MSQISTAFDRDERDFRETEKRRRAMIFAAREAKRRGMEVPEDFFTAVQQGAVYDPGIQEAQRTIQSFNRAQQGIPELSEQFPMARRGAEELARQRIQQGAFGDGATQSLAPLSPEEIEKRQARIRSTEAQTPIGSPGLIPQAGPELQAITEEVRRNRERMLGIQGAQQEGEERRQRAVPAEVETAQITGDSQVRQSEQNRMAQEAIARGGMIGDIVTATEGSRGLIESSKITADSGREVGLAEVGARRFESEQETARRAAENEALIGETNQAREEQGRQIASDAVARISEPISKVTKRLSRGGLFGLNSRKLQQDMQTVLLGLGTVPAEQRSPIIDQLIQSIRAGVETYEPTILRSAAEATNPAILNSVAQRQSYINRSNRLIEQLESLR